MVQRSRVLLVHGGGVGGCGGVSTKTEQRPYKTDETSIFRLTRPFFLDSLSPSSQTRRSLPGERRVARKAEDVPRQVPTSSLEGGTARHGAVLTARKRGANSVAVGTPVTQRPPHRSRRAELPHRAPASGRDAQALVRMRMSDSRQREPALTQAGHTSPGDLVLLAPAPQNLAPSSTHFIS